MQIAYNEKHGITPKTVTKNVADILGRLRSETREDSPKTAKALTSLEGSMPSDLALEIGRVEEAMLEAASELRFEEAAALRDALQNLQRQLLPNTQSDTED
jgi:excinuclease ABC subunit B